MAPERAFNDQPNSNKFIYLVKAGSLDQSKMVCYDSNDDPKVINKKFSEFVRIMDEQSGIVKRKRMSDSTTDNHSLPAIKSPYKISMKKTYFKKYPSDNYNFYRPPIK